VDAVKPSDNIVPQLRRAIAALLLIILSLGAAQAQPAPRPWLEKAKDVALWLEAQALEDGSIPADLLSAESVRHDLASGTAGHILLHGALYELTGDYEHLSALQARADLLVRNLPTTLDLELFPPPSSFYYGIAGMSFALHRASRLTGDENHREAADRALRLLIEEARTDERGLRYWSDRYDEILFGNTGTALFLLYAAAEMGSEDALELSIEQGKRLIESAQIRGDGWTWPMRNDRPDVELPNFSHGAAGIGYFLATLSMLSDDPRFLAGAVSAANHLEHLAVREFGGVLFPYGFPRPEWDGRHDLGWAHGVTGSARLFQRLHQLTGQQRWSELLEDCTAAVLRSNAPREPAPGFGDGPFALDRRFGLAGVAEFLVGRHRQQSEPAYLEKAEEIAQHIYLEASRDEPGLYWETPRPAFVDRPGEPARYGGWFTGATGYALLFVELDAATRGANSPLALPDDPNRFIPAP
jgi:lantibiotic modifying enzyme